MPRKLRITYLDEDGTESKALEIFLSASAPSPLVDGVPTLQAVVAAVDSAVTGIVR